MILGEMFAYLKNFSELCNEVVHNRDLFLSQKSC